MWRRHRFTVLITATVAAITMVSLLLASQDPKEPAYKGLTMIQWFARTDTPAREEALDSFVSDHLQLLVHRLDYEQQKDRKFALYLQLPARLKTIKFVKSLCTQDFENTEAAFFILQRLGPHGAPAVPELTRLVKNGSPQGAQRALTILSGIGERAVPGILAGMSNTDQNVRRFALFNLERYRHSPSAWQAITNALADPDPTTRQQAAVIMGHALN